MIFNKYTQFTKEKCIHFISQSHEQFSKKTRGGYFSQGVVRSARSEAGPTKLISKLCGRSEFERRKGMLKEMPPD